MGSGEGGVKHWSGPVTLEWFNRKVSPEPNTGCHLWEGALSNTGHAVAWLAKERMYAHRLSYRLSGKRIPTTHVLRCQCGIQSCVNPEHWKLIPRGMQKLGTKRKKGL